FATDYLRWYPQRAKRLITKLAKLDPEYKDFITDELKNNTDLNGYLIADILIKFVNEELLPNYPST
ncbi:MAG: hypothetical protein KGJ93_05465, partial [Patescibacteria group bacterium]|nr:hypothetical protein [Patescibacteria group bacterium]